MTASVDPETVLDLFTEYRRTGRRRHRNELVEAHMGLAHHIASRYSRRGVPHDDLHQVALLALVKAVDRFDPDNGAAFSTFAGRTIEGELKRHFRDASWSVRVPRSTKELHLEVRRATDELSARDGRSPTAADVAAYLDVDQDDVIQALAAGNAYTSASIDAPGPGGADTDGRYHAYVSETDDQLDDVPDRLLLEELLADLPERERRIVELRYVDEKSQTEIAEIVGISQMHVSRLLRRAVDTMRQRADR